MEWVYDDGGRKAAGFKGSSGDCVIRAIAIAAQLPYREVYDELQTAQHWHKLMGKDKTAKAMRARQNNSVRNGTSKVAYKPYIEEELGWTWVPTMKIGSGCQVHLEANELPSGRIICRLSKHLVAVIDGVIHDTYSPYRAAHSVRRFPGWEDYELKKGEWRNENGICSIQKRCVYGYWHQ